MSTSLLNCIGCADSTQVMKCARVLANATNIHDVELTTTICSSIELMTGIVVGGFLAWKLLDHIANGISGYYKRKWTLQDIARKQKAIDRQQEKK